MYFLSKYWVDEKKKHFGVFENNSKAVILFKLKILVTIC